MDLVTDSYISIFSKLIDYAPFTILTFFILGLMRIAPIVAMVPFFGSKVPAPIKMGLLISLTVVMLPQIVLTSTGIVGFDSQFLVLCMKELFVGILLAFFASIPFYMAESAGTLIDFQRGSSALQVTDPSTQEQISPIGVLYNYVLIVIFYQVDGPFHFFNALYDSYAVVPSDKWYAVAFFHHAHPFWKQILGLAATVFSVGIQLAAPSLLAILMTEMFLGIANRLAPQVQIVFLGMSLKSLVGLAILCAAWFFILQQMNKLTLLWMQNLTKAIHLFQT